MSHCVWPANSEISKMLHPRLDMSLYKKGKKGLFFRSFQQPSCFLIPKIQIVIKHKKKKDWTFAQTAVQNWEKQSVFKHFSRKVNSQLVLYRHLLMSMRGAFIDKKKRFYFRIKICHYQIFVCLDCVLLIVCLIVKQIVSTVLFDFQFRSFFPHIVYFSSFMKFWLHFEYIFYLTMVF